MTTLYNKSYSALYAVALSDHVDLDYSDWSPDETEHTPIRDSAQGAPFAESESKDADDLEYLFGFEPMQERSGISDDDEYLRMADLGDMSKVPF